MKRNILRSFGSNLWFALKSTIVLLGVVGFAIAPLWGAIWLDIFAGPILLGVVFLQIVWIIATIATFHEYG